MPRHRPQVDAVAVVVVRRRHAVQHDRQFNWLALLIERHLLGKLGRLDLAEREQAVAKTRGGTPTAFKASRQSVTGYFQGGKNKLFSRTPPLNSNRFRDAGQ